MNFNYVPNTKSVKDFADHRKQDNALHVQNALSFSATRSMTSYTTPCLT